MAGAGGIPTALALQSGTIKITPFITPGIGYGRLGNVKWFDDEPPSAYGSIAFMIGGGVGLEFGTSGIGANVGFQRVLKGEGGTTQLGIGMTWNGLTAARGRRGEPQQSLGIPAGEHDQRLIGPPVLRLL